MTEGNDDTTTLPVGLKRCSKCRFPRPRSERFFFPRRGNKTACVSSLNSACRLCAAFAQRLYRNSLKAKDPVALARREAAYRERRAADPERAAVHRLYNREKTREYRGITPDRYRVREPDGWTKVPSLPVREAFVASALNLNEVAARAGRDREGLARALAAESMTLSAATAVLRAIDVDPVEVGL